MNLDTIAIAPHAQGFIKVAREDDPLFQTATRNEFLITMRHHADGGDKPDLAPHPICHDLAKGDQEGQAAAVKEIPIRMYFNRTENALSIRYQAYSKEGSRPVCSGNGKTAKRLMLAGDQTPTLQEIPCPGPELCELVQSGAAVCRRQVRMAVQVVGQGDPLSVFEVRSGSLNSYRALKAQLHLVERKFGGLRHVPLKLTLWQASNELSGFQPFDLMQLKLDAPSEVAAMQEAKTKREELVAAGICDDVDELTGAVSDDEAFTSASLDFQAVTEFYQGAARRPGTMAITTSGRARAQLSTPPVAGDAIARAVRGGQETGAPGP
jgi:hypothetical protein